MKDGPTQKQQPQRQYSTTIMFHNNFQDNFHDGNRKTRQQQSQRQQQQQYDQYDSRHIIGFSDSPDTNARLSNRVFANKVEW